MRGWLDTLSEAMRYSLAKFMTFCLRVTKKGGINDRVLTSSATAEICIFHWTI